MKLALTKNWTYYRFGSPENRLGADKSRGFQRCGWTSSGRGAPRLLVLDLSKVDFIDSSGLYCNSFDPQAHAEGLCELILCGATEHVTSMFKLTRLDRVFTMKKNSG